jgi:hypothetical protein
VKAVGAQINAGNDPCSLYAGTSLVCGAEQNYIPFSGQNTAIGLKQVRSVILQQDLTAIDTTEFYCTYTFH